MTNAFSSRQNKEAKHDQTSDSLVTKSTMLVVQVEGHSLGGTLTTSSTKAQITDQSSCADSRFNVT